MAVFVVIGWGLTFTVATFYYLSVFRLLKNESDRQLTTYALSKQEQLNQLIEVGQTQLQELVQLHAGTLNSDWLAQKLPFTVFESLSVQPATESGIPESLRLTERLRTEPEKWTHLLVGVINKRLVHQILDNQSPTAWMGIVTAEGWVESTTNSTMPDASQFYSYCSQGANNLPQIIQLPSTDGGTNQSVLLTSLPPIGCLVTIDNQNSFSSAIHQFQQTIFITTLAVTFGVIIGVWLVTHRIGVRMRKLKDTMDRVAGGDLDTPIGDNFKDEMSEVYKVLDYLRRQVKQSHHQLEAQVKLRTTELQQKIKELEELQELTADVEINAEKMRKERDKYLTQLQRLQDKRSH